jgi:hypothetical protein
MGAVPYAFSSAAQARAPNPKKVPRFYRLDFDQGVWKKSDLRSAAVF